MRTAFSLDALPDVVLVLERTTLVVLDVNRAEGLFARAALVGQSLTALIPGATAELFARAKSGAHDPHRDAPLRVRILVGGELVPVDLRVSELDDATLLTTLRVLSEEARIAERELVQVVCAVPAAIVTCRVDGVIVSWNPAAEQLFGIQARDAIGLPFASLVPAGDVDDHRAVVARVVQGEGVPAREVMRLHKDGEIAVEEALFRICDPAGAVVRVGAFFRDLAALARLRRANEVMATQRRAKAAPPSGSMAAVMAKAEQAALDPRASVLLIGETGVGKSRLARHIHEGSPRAKGPLLEINCAGLDGPLVDSELFGHERGAFTGALQQKVGIVEAAHGGTLFLDEVGELPLGAQARLLTFLDEGTFRRVGGVKKLDADVRVVTATNTELERAVADGRFRKDLYFRLRVVPIEIPPLRERRGEIPALAEALLADLCAKRRATPPGFGRGVVDALQAHAWPGNVRELRNALEHALILSRGGALEREHFPLEVDRATAKHTRSDALADVVQAHIEAVIAREGGNVTRAAAALGIDRATLRRRLKGE
jgi:PAS domain S-box-containing protein